MHFCKQRGKVNYSHFMLFSSVHNFRQVDRAICYCINPYCYIEPDNFEIIFNKIRQTNIVVNYLRQPR